MSKKPSEKLPSGLQLHRGLYRIRKVIPVELRELAFEFFNVRTEFLVPLHTDSRSLATVLFHKEIEKVENKLNVLKGSLFLPGLKAQGKNTSSQPPGLEILDIDECISAVESWLHEALLKGWNEARSGGIPDFLQVRFAEYSDWAHPRSKTSSELAEHNFRLDPSPPKSIKNFDQKMISALESRGIRAGSTDPKLRNIRPIFRDCWCQLLDAELRWAQEIGTGKRPTRPDVPEEMVTPASIQPTVDVKTAKRFSALVDDHLKLSGNNHEDANITKRRFIESMKADKFVVEITSQDVKTYRDLLLKLPARPASGDHGKGIHELSEIYSTRTALFIDEVRRRKLLVDVNQDDDDDDVEEDGAVRPMADFTIKKSLTTLKVIFDHAVADEIISHNPAAVISKKLITRGIAEERLPFDDCDIRALFSGPIHNGMHSIVHRRKAGKIVLGNADYWLPLLGLFTGCRLEELGQALTEDIRVKDGIHFISISEKDLKNRIVKQLKNKSAIRNVPLHRDLIRLGFLDYVEAVRSRDIARLFPDLKHSILASGAPKVTKDYSSKRFSPYRVSRGVVGMKSFHSFRHTFKKASEGSRWDMQDAVLGHAKPQNAGSDYMKRQDISLYLLQEVVEKISFPSLPAIAKPTHVLFERPDKTSTLIPIEHARVDQIIGLQISD